jgi:capsular exopolysaccharide synthesis family protein
MSKVFKALEKAEREKRSQPIPGGTPIAAIEFDSIRSKDDRPILKDLIREIEKIDLPKSAGQLIPVSENDSFAAEQFRKIKTHIFRIAPTPPRCILITSTVPQEGKTTVTVNLATSIAQEFHKRVVVIDADLRSPSVYPLQFAKRKGLSDYLSSDTQIEEILKTFDGEKFIVIPAGAPSSRAAELIASDKMKSLIKTLKDMDEETFILIDSPPILAASEPLMLSEWVDGAILVVMADQATRGVIKKAFRAINPQKVIGIVFNNKNLKPSKSYSDYYYGYHKK